MSNEVILRNARLVLEDEVVTGAIVLRDGVIADIATGNGAVGEDCEGDYVVPGLVELHTDHLEGHFAPRPKVRWNPSAAVLAHDAQVASSGITTVFDALRVGVDPEGEMTTGDMLLLADAIEEGGAHDRLRADHYLHVRCEVSAPDCLDGFRMLAEDRRVDLVSLMDHAPGQRQFAWMESYRAYYQGKLRMSDTAFAAFCEARLAESAQYSAPHRAAISDICRERGIVLASHDDATLAHVEEAIGQGARVAEFPTTLEAARAAHEAGMSVLMGAPNLVRGGSHSGNVSARDLVDRGQLDVLSSDYVPFSLLQAAFQIGEAEDGIPLPEAIAMVSRNPAGAVGLDDRGVLAPGRRADVVRVRGGGPIPVVRSVWREGRRVV